MRCLEKAYAKEPFVHVLPFGTTPQTRHVRGSNMTFIGVAADRIAGRAIIISALDNLTKGASGQAVQNMNVMLGFPETIGPRAGRVVSVRRDSQRDVQISLKIASTSITCATKPPTKASVRSTGMPSV